MIEKKKYDIKGMSCAACQASVEKSVNKLDGIESCQVNLISNSMEVSFDDEKTSSDDIINSVIKAGYGANEKGKAGTNQIQEKDHGLRDLIIAIVDLIILMYVNMGHMIGIPLPPFLAGPENALLFAFTQFLLTLVPVYIYRRYFINGYKRLFKLDPNMDSLIALGATASLLYGIVEIYLIGYGLGHGNMDLVDTYMHDLYFESAAMILTLVSLGKYLESRAKRKTRNAIDDILNLSPKKAIVIKDGKEVNVDTASIRVDDIVVVKKGMLVPIDGIVVEGEGTLNTANITGESLPQYKGMNDEVISSSILESGYIKIRALKVGEDTTISQIARLVEEASNSKAPISRIADKVAKYFVPTVMGIALIAFIVWISITRDFVQALKILITVLVVACPCALGLATPLSIMVSTGMGARNGILFKEAKYIEAVKDVDTIILDKTGTITSGKLSIKGMEAFDRNFEKLLYTLESKSEHPLAKPIVEKYKDMEPFNVTDFGSIEGEGIYGTIFGNKYYATNERGLKKLHPDYNKKGGFKSAMTIFLFDEKKVYGEIYLADTIKEDAKETIDKLHKLGKKIIMLTGDNADVALEVAQEVGIESYVANVLPSDKYDTVKKEKELGHKVMMVGDGVNDAASLALADIGVAIGSGTDIAISSADVILMGDGLASLAKAIKLSKMTINNIKLSLFWAFFYNLITIFLATGALASLNVILNPMYASILMSLSSLFVVCNALSLRLHKLDNTKKNDLPKSERKEKVKMNEFVLKVDGMMCEHCKKRVEDAVNSLPGVKSVDVNLKTKEVKVTAEESVTTLDVAGVITDAGYKVIG